MTLTIKSGDYQAVIVPEGAGLASLTYRGRDLVVPHDPNVTPKGYSGKILVPWPNRIAGAAYQWGGQQLTLESNEAATGAALHGLRSFSSWEVVSQSQNSVTLSTQIDPTPGYPFTLDAQTHYTLGLDGLEVRVTAQNRGTVPAPYGVSLHPYLSAGPVDDCVLTIPAETVLDVDHNLTPIGEIPAGNLNLDFRAGLSMHGRSVDHAFSSLPDGKWTVSLVNLGTGAGVKMTADQRWVQAYSGEELDRAGVGVEPMSCPPNAFNTGIDLVVLEPGETHTFTTHIADASLEGDLFLGTASSPEDLSVRP